MSELEELPSWAGRSMSGSKPAQADPAGQPQDRAGASSQDALTNPATAADQTVDLGADRGQPTGITEQRAAASPQYTPERRRRRPWLMLLFGLLGVLALVGMGALGYLLAQSQNSSETATSSETAPSADVEPADEAADEGATTEAATETDDAAEGGAVTVDTASDDGTATEEDAGGAEGDAADGSQENSAADGDATTDGAGTDESGADDAEDGSSDGAAETVSERQAIFRGGKVYLSGPVPSEEVSAFIAEKAAAVVGPDNVVNEYVIDPTTVIEPGSSAPLYVEDVVLFPFNSVEIASPFLPILDLGTLLLRQNPQASITVVTRTDATGSEEVNLDVSNKRAQAVINYWLSKGVDRDQIKADPRGEEGASESDDEEAAALRRRAEFIITGLLD